MKNKVLIISFEKFRKTSKYSDVSRYVTRNMINSGFRLLDVVGVYVGQKSKVAVEDFIKYEGIERGTIVWRRLSSGRGRFIWRTLKIYYNPDVLF